jgi:L-lysine exporter family protein LysE/ArgO
MLSTSVPFWSGLGTGLGLIIAIGSQNAYVLKQGLLRNHTFAIALTCSLIDAILILLGIGGFGLIITKNTMLLNIARFGGAGFLIFYGIKSFASIFKNEYMIVDNSKSKPRLKTTILTVIALTLLNPHVYLDTCVLIGTIGVQFPEAERDYFTLGAVLASFVWFFSLSYGAKLLLPFFKSSVSWKILDFLIAIVMWVIAGLLIYGM